STSAAPTSGWRATWRAPCARAGPRLGRRCESNERRAVSAQVVETDVVVVGAGVAGLSAARKLVAEGRDVVVLEARHPGGGRLWNTEIGGEANELGGEGVAPYQSRLQSLLPELGIELFRAYREGDDVYVDEAGRAHRYVEHATPLGSASGNALESGQAKLD